MAGDPIDKHVGARLRMARYIAGVTQQLIAESLSLTFQQVQKYEQGVNRLSAARLVRLALLLGQRPEWFFEDLPAEVQGAGVRGQESDYANYEPDQTTTRREAIELSRHFSAIDNEKLRGQFLTFVRALGRSAIG